MKSSNVDVDWGQSGSVGKNKGGCHSNKELSRYGKAWYSFICAKMIPITHVSDVVKERAVLLFAIMKGKTIDVG